jgi:hypothetical protein
VRLCFPILDEENNLLDHADIVSLEEIALFLYPFPQVDFLHVEASFMTAGICIMRSPCCVQNFESPCCQLHVVGVFSSVDVISDSSVRFYFFNLIRTVMRKLRESALRERLGAVAWSA